MARKMNSTEFFKAFGEKINVPYEEVKRIYAEFVEFIVDELMTYGNVRLPYMCDWTLEQRGGKYQAVPAIGENGERKGLAPNIMYVEPYYVLKNHFSRNMGELVNGKKESQASWMRRDAALKKAKAEAKAIEKQREVIEKQLNSQEDAFAKMRDSHDAYAKNFRKKNKISNEMKRYLQDKELHDPELEAMFEEKLAEDNDSMWSDFDDELWNDLIEDDEDEKE